MTNLEIIQELYRSFSSKDYEAFLKISSPDLEWIQNAGFPNGKRHKGAKAVVENVFKSFDVKWAEWEFQIEEFLEARDSIVVIGSYRGLHRETGKRFRSDAAHVYDLKDGKVIRFRQFADTKTIWDAMS